MYRSIYKQNIIKTFVKNYGFSKFVKLSIVSGAPNGSLFLIYITNWLVLSETHGKPFKYHGICMHVGSSQQTCYRISLNEITEPKLDCP